MVMNVPMVAVVEIGTTDAIKKKNIVLQVDNLSSALEHAVPERMFVTPENPGEAISAVKALSKASSERQRIYQVNKVNMTTTLPNIYHDPATIAEIVVALNVGKEVVTHTDTVSVLGWSGAGYIIVDPVTGEGVYKIGGGTNGGFFLDYGWVFSLGALALGLAGLVFWPLLISFAVAGFSWAGLVYKLDPGPCYESTVNGFAIAAVVGIGLSAVKQAQNIGQAVSFAIALLTDGGLFETIGTSSGCRP